MKYVTVLQGECRVSKDPEVVLSTVLGSCVAVCMHDPEASIGGMNHFLLPGDSAGGSGDMRYGVHSMELLINDMLKLGAQRRRLVAKVFGGASVIKKQSNIGKSNGEFATSFLQREGIPVRAQDLGGTQARRLKFQASSGDVQHLLVPPTSDLMEPARPKNKPAPQPDVTLF